MGSLTANKVVLLGAVEMQSVISSFLTADHCIYHSLSRGDTFLYFVQTLNNIHFSYIKSETDDPERQTKLQMRFLKSGRCDIFDSFYD